MATLNYRDPTSGDWVAVPVIAGPAGPPGPAGPTGVAAVSATGGNTAVLGTDGQIFVPAGGLDPATATARYVDVPGDAMTGELQVPDQTAVDQALLSPLTAAARGYVDQVVTVSDVEPTGVAPKRDGQAWFVVEAALTQQPTTTTLAADVTTMTAGGPVVLTADTTADTGTVQFKRDGVNLGTPVAVDPSGVAVMTDAPVTLGAVAYTAEYVAAGNWAGSVSNSASVSITPAQPTMTLTTPPAAAGEPTSITAELSAPPLNARPIINQGSVTFYIDDIPIEGVYEPMGTADVVNNTATLNFTAPAGNSIHRNFSATYTDPTGAFLTATDMTSEGYRWRVTLDFTCTPTSGTVVSTVFDYSVTLNLLHGAPHPGGNYSIYSRIGVLGGGSVVSSVPWNGLTYYAGTFTFPVDMVGINHVGAGFKPDPPNDIYTHSDSPTIEIVVS